MPGINNIDKDLVDYILDNIPDGVVIIDNQSQILYINSAALRITGSEGNVIGISIKELLPLDFDINVIEEYKEFHFRIDKENSKTVLLQINKLSENKTIIIINPLERYDNAIDDLKNLSNKAIRASKEKSIFLASMSHDLRTPMHSVIGFSQALLDGIAGDMPEKQTKYISIINRNANILLRMLNNIVDLSKIEAGKMVYRVEEVSIKQFIQNIMENLQPMIEKKELQSSLNINELRIEEIYTDPNLLSEVVTNLLENSIKYTDKGFVSLEITHPDLTLVEEKLVDKVDDYKPESYILVTVRDSGSGIPEEQINHIFEEYYVIDEGRTKKYGSTGLGLAIANKIVKVLGGSIWADKNDTAGAVFKFIIPVRTLKDS